MNRSESIVNLQLEDGQVQWENRKAVEVGPRASVLPFNRDISVLLPTEGNFDIEPHGSIAIRSRQLALINSAPKRGARELIGGRKNDLPTAQFEGIRVGTRHWDANWDYFCTIVASITAPTIKRIS